MKKYILKRIGIAALTLLVILFILFIMLELMPGSPFNDEKLTDAQRAIINAKYGLDKPVFLRFFNYLKAMLSGDFGVSYNISKNTPITQLLESRLPLSLRIGGQAVLIGTAVGIVLGLIAAVKHNTIFDTLTTVISVLGVSLPSYVFAMALIYSMGFKLKWFPLLYQLDAPFHSTVLPTVVYAAGGKQGHASKPSDLCPCAEKCPHSHHHGTGSSCGEPYDRKPCYREAFFYSRDRISHGHGHPVQ